MDRKKTNPSQIQVATGITRQALYAVLNGQTENLSWPILVKLSKFLGVRPEWMAEGEQPMESLPTFDVEELRLVKDFQKMSPQHQKDLREIATRWADEDDEAPARTRSNIRQHRRQ